MCVRSGTLRVRYAPKHSRLTHHIAIAILAHRLRTARRRKNACDKTLTSRKPNEKQNPDSHSDMRRAAGTGRQGAERGREDERAVRCRHDDKPRRRGRTGSEMDAGHLGQLQRLDAFARPPLETLARTGSATALRATSSDSTPTAASTTSAG